MNKVPIGKQRTTSKLVLVQEVPAGQACDCICNSCGMTLIARQGRKNIWHFAHSKSRDAHATDLCDYSADVSIKDLILQEADKIREFTTPDYVYRKYGYEDYPVTTAKKLKIESVECGVRSLAGISDLLLNIQGHKLHILLRTSSQNLGYDLSKAGNDGVLKINISGLLLRIEHNDFSDKSNLIKQLCESDSFIKSWVYHPRTPAEGQLTPKVIAPPPNEANRPSVNFSSTARAAEQRPPLIPSTPVIRPIKVELTEYDLKSIRAKCRYNEESAYHCKKCGHISYVASDKVVVGCTSCEETNGDTLWKVV